MDWEEEEGLEEGRPVRNTVSGLELRWWQWELNTRGQNQKDVDRDESEGMIVEEND